MKFESEGVSVFCPLTGRGHCSEARHRSVKVCGSGRSVDGNIVVTLDAAYRFTSNIECELTVERFTTKVTKDERRRKFREKRVESQWKTGSEEG